MPKELILTMTAANRIGILAAVTRAMADLEGDLREASQTVVRGWFTMIFSAEFPDELSEDVIRAHILDTCRPFGIDVGIKDPAREIQGGAVNESTELHMLRMGGENRPGVLRELSTVMSKHQVNIIGMRAVSVRDRQGFEMVIKISVPHGSDITTLVNDLNAAGLAFSMTVDVKDVG